MSLKLDHGYFNDAGYSFNPDHNNQQEAAVVPPAEIAMLNGKILTVDTLSTPLELKAVQKTIKIWKEIAYDRLAIMRAAADEKLIDFREATTDENKSLCKQNHEEAMSELHEDRDIVEKYCEVLQLYEQHAQSQIRIPIERANIHFRIVRDADRNIQAMTIFTLYEHQVYLNLIMTAPWNLKMHAPILDLHKHLITKGGGTSLIASVYKTAQDLQKSELRLKTMDNSYAFYKDCLQMSEDSEGFFFPVSKDTPEPLKRFV